MTSLFAEKLEGSTTKNFMSLMEQLQRQINLFLSTTKISPYNREFFRSSGIKHTEKFILESVIIYFSKVIFMKYCLDNGILGVTDSKDPHEIVCSFYDEFKRHYFNFTYDELYEYYIPLGKLNRELFEILSNYDFAEISHDLIGNLYEQFIDRRERILLGQVYTPTEVVDYILQRVGYTLDADLKDKKLIDISCGTGAFLVRAANVLIKNLTRKGYEPRFIFEAVQNNIIGLDINPFSLKLAEINLLFTCLELLQQVKKADSLFRAKNFKLYLTNSVNKNDSNDENIVFNIKNRLHEFQEGFDFVIGNPPYLEAKKMPVELKTICKSNFPEVAKGGFDLYICFVKMGLDLLKKDGMFGYILPNKIQVLKSAKELRRYILDNFNIEEIVDISNIKVFQGISVYPILLFIRNYKNLKNRIETFDSVDNLASITQRLVKPVEIQQKNWLKNEDLIFYTLPNNKTGIEIYHKLSQGEFHQLKEYLDIRWTISFHKKELIKDFVFKQPTGLYPKPILGGDIHSRDTEVQQYRVNWSGFWIDYDVEKAKKIKNPLPPKEIFETEKLIIRQHAERLTATYDEGYWYLKDVFFSARLKAKAKSDDISLKYLLGVLNSRLLNYYYSILFKGGHVNDGYLHFLVGYLNTLPVKRISPAQQSEITEIVNSILENYDESLKREVDIRVCDLYGLNKDEICFIMSQQ